MSRVFRTLFCTVLLVSLISCGDSSPGPAIKAPGKGPQAETQAWSVMPPGNGNIFGRTKDFLDDQREMYDEVQDLVADETFSTADLPEYYKDSRMGLHTDVAFEQLPREGVVIKWDKYGVPHITGETAPDVAFGSGYATAEARALIAEAVRAVGRLGIIELGIDIGSALEDPLALLSGPAIDYSPEELEAQLDLACEYDPEHCREMIEIAENHAAGINRWYKDTLPILELFDNLHIPWPRWKTSDIVASAITIGTMFGFGGGNEIANGHALRLLVEQFGDEKAQAMYQDLRMAEAEAVTQVGPGFSYPVFSDGSKADDEDRDIDWDSVALLDDGLEGTPPPLALTLLTRRTKVPSASNFLMVGPERTRSRRSVFAGGPQTGYLAPELLFEVELEGGGYQSTGMTVPGLGIFVLVGHTRHYGWSITAGSTDIVDQRLEKLCEPDGSTPTMASEHYLYDGECIPFIRKTLRGLPRSVHGPIISTGTVNGDPVAVALDRASRGVEAVAAVSLRRLNFGEVSQAADFPLAMHAVPYSMNWAYLNATEIAYAHTGRFPIRQAGTVPDLPVWGTGEWEWQGFLSAIEKPHAVNPVSGYISSWNNRVAPGWNTADNQWGSGLYQRIVNLDGLLGQRNQLSPGDVNSIVQQAATTDLRGYALLPPVLTQMQETQAPEAYLAEAVLVLADWVDNGSQRRDRDKDGFYDHPAIPLIDEYVYALTDAVLDTNLGGLKGELPLPGVTNAPNPSGSSFMSGRSQYLLNALSRAVDQRLDDKALQCGDGSLSGCCDLLWEALDTAYWRAYDEQPPENRQDVWSWAKSTEEEKIQFPLGGTPDMAIRWQNRATFYQVLSFQ